MDCKIQFIYKGFNMPSIKQIHIQFDPQNKYLGKVDPGHDIQDGHYNVEVSHDEHQDVEQNKHNADYIAKFLGGKKKIDNEKRLEGLVKVEQSLVEISKNKLSNYIANAASDLAQRSTTHASIASNQAINRMGKNDPDKEKELDKDRDDNFSKIIKRKENIAKAAYKLTKEDLDIVEGLSDEDLEYIFEYEIHQRKDGKYVDDEGNVFDGKDMHSNSWRKRVVSNNYSLSRKYNNPKSSGSNIEQDVPHDVYFGDKKWKTFPSKSHAQNVANKLNAKNGNTNASIKPSIQNEDTEMKESYGAQILDSIINNKPIEAQEYFGAAMANIIKSNIDSLKQDIAKNIFNKE